MNTIGIGLIGCGTVGTGVARLLLEQGDRLALRAGRRLQLRRVVVRDPNKDRGIAIPRELLTTDVRQVIDDPSIQIAVEVVGGVDWPRQTILDLLAAGKDVVTANKALLAQHGHDLFDAARRCDRSIAFEASVGGGVPIITALTQSLTANQILAIQGILNGTCNFILTSMTENDMSYPHALMEAQREGYAEADPTLDVDGTDSAHKLAILAQIAFGTNVPLTAIDRRGIAEVQELDIRFGKEMGYTMKLLAEAWLDTANGKPHLALHVSPVFLRKLDPLAQVRGPYNAIHVVGDAVGDTLFYGRGAGQMPTASAVVADLIDMTVGRAQRTFQTLKLWSGQGADIALRTSDTVRSRFYLRMIVADRPGVLSEIDGVLARHGISIASLTQHEKPEEPNIKGPLVVMTHTALTGDFRRAVAEIDELKCVTPPSVFYPTAD